MKHNLWVEEKDNHCKDCCCHASWVALGIVQHTGKSIPEHIEQLRKENEEKCETYLREIGRLINAKERLKQRLQFADRIIHAVNEESDGKES